MAVDIGTGAAVVFTGVTMPIRNVRHQGVERPAINSSHLGTVDWHTKIPGDLVDPGRLTLDVLIDPQLIDSLPLNGAPATCILTFPLQAGQATPALVSGSAFLVSAEWGAPLEEMLTGTITLEFTGALTRTDAT